MTREELEKHAEFICQYAMKQQLGGYFVLVDKKGVMSIYNIPEWGVLRLDESKNKMTLSGISPDQTMNDWLEQLDLSSYFLEAIHQNAVKAAATMDGIQGELKKMLEGFIKDLDGMEPPENVTRIH